MNTSLTAYTHLESLLLFQSLNAYGLGSSVFSRVSELLKNNPTITSDKRFQSGRLSPDALRNFVQQILYQEIKSEQRQDGVDIDGQNGEVRNSRKRKAPSPNSPSVQEAAQHAHLIPKLVTKLYARYRTALTHEIRDEEDNYERLQRELQSIERGERDNDLLERANGKRSPSVPRKSPLLHQKPPPGPSPQLAVQDGNRVATPSGNAHIPDRPQQPGTESPKPLAPPNGRLPIERNVKNVPSPSPRKKHGAPPTPQSLRAPSPGPVPVPSPPQNQTPQPLAPQPPFHQQPPSNVAFNGPQPFTPQSPYPQQVPQLRARGPLPTSPHAPNQQPTHPQSPAAHPPGVQIQLQPIQPYGGNGVPQYGPLSGQPPFPSPNQRLQGQFPPGSQSPGIQPPQQQWNLYPHPGQPPHPPQQVQAGQPPPQGGFMLPPFQVSPQDPSRVQQQHTSSQHAQLSTPINQRPPLSTKTSSSATGSAWQGLPPLQPPVYQPRGSTSTPMSIRTPYSATGTPRSAKTLWKPIIKDFATPPAPRPEPSPIDDLDLVDEPKQSRPKAKGTRRTRAKGKAKEKESQKENEAPPKPEQPEEQVPEIDSRQGRSLRRGATRRGRRGSIASSRAGDSVRERSRSQSIISHTETIAAENDSQAGARVKSERGTSIDVIAEDSAGTPSHATRRRVGTLQTAFKGRKRNAREASLAESEDQPRSPGMPKTIIAPRHFSRMCNPIMNDIGSHKHASIFTTAVKTKDAEGYYDIIKRPTDLKTIQKAIASGAKAVTAAASDTPAGSPGGGGGIIELPLTTDVAPPKAVVNSAQLEKELMRMFVNAVMFNAGEEGVVSDAREMFESTQQSVSNWRNAERSSGRLEVEETPAPVVEEEPPVQAPKRRKL